jgi:hypothetical protein
MGPRKLPAALSAPRGSAALDPKVERDRAVTQRAMFASIDGRKLARQQMNLEVNGETP